MKKIIITFILLLFFITSCCAREPKEFIELHPLRVLAYQFDVDKRWVSNNIKIKLFKDPFTQKQLTGRLLPGSRAIIIKKIPGAYLVKSPYDGSIGWVHRSHVARTLWQDTETEK